MSDDDLGLSIDMLDADWLRVQSALSDDIDTIRRLITLSDAIEQAVRDIGTLRRMAGLTQPQKDDE